MRPRRHHLIALALASLWSAGLTRADESAALAITSSAFPPGARIPAQYGCDGADQSPALSWTATPSGTRSFALIVDDPDAPAGTWVHWVVYDIPGAATQLPAGVAKSETLPNGAKQGLNDFRKVGYNGPCPPQGKPHRYSFRLYALDASTALTPRATKAQVLSAIKAHVLAQAELIGTYQH